MTFAHVHNKIQNEDNTVKHKSYIIKKRLNNKISFVKFILYNWQFKAMTAGSQPHGARWPRFHGVQMIKAMSLAAAVLKKMIMSILC